MTIETLDPTPAMLDALDRLLGAAYGHPVWRAQLDRFVSLYGSGWRVVLEYGEPVACGMAVSYGRFGWIGLVATRPDRERQGLGRRITAELLGWLRAGGVETIALDASDKGQGLYAQLGFRVVGHVRALAAPTLLPSTTLRPAADGDLATIDALDAETFGVPRADLHRYLRGEGARYVITDGGFACVQPEGTIGPAMARSATAAAALLTVSGATRLLLPPGSSYGELADSLGFIETRRLARMVLGPTLPGRRDLELGVANYATG